jgi:hypothetical protein
MERCRQFDSMDICHLASFFFGAAAGQFELHAPRPGGSVTMTAHKAIAGMQQRAKFATCSGAADRAGECGAAADTPSPSRHPGREPLARGARLLTEDERRWRTCAAWAAGGDRAELGGTAEARRSN